MTRGFGPVLEAAIFLPNQVPFIATFRREYIEPELDEEDLWKIWQWDEKVKNCNKDFSYIIAA